MFVVVSHRSREMLFVKRETYSTLTLGVAGLWMVFRVSSLGFLVVSSTRQIGTYDSSCIPHEREAREMRDKRDVER